METGRLVLPLRLAALSVGYIVYRLVEPNDFAAGLLLGLGIWLAGSSLAERYTIGWHGTTGKLLAAATVAGAALVVAGLILAVR